MAYLMFKIICKNHYTEIKEILQENYKKFNAKLAGFIS
jgi:hypothetical protein